MNKNIRLDLNVQLFLLSIKSLIDVKLFKEFKILLVGNRKFKFLFIQEGYNLFFDGKKFCIESEKSEGNCVLKVFSEEEKEEITEVLRNFKISYKIISKSTKRKKAEYKNPLSKNFLGYTFDQPNFHLRINYLPREDIFENLLDCLRQLGYKTYWDGHKKTMRELVSSHHHPRYLILR